MKEKSNKASDLLKYCINHQIRAERINVIDQHGVNLGCLVRQQAIATAHESGLDLVQVGDKDGVPIAKIMDFGKFLYAKKKQLNDAKKHQKVIVIKEIKFRPNIGDQDYKTKLGQAVQFLLDGNKVKFTLQFRGREVVMMEDVGMKFYARIVNDLNQSNVGTIVEEKETRGGSLWTKILYAKQK